MKAEQWFRSGGAGLGRVRGGGQQCTSIIQHKAADQMSVIPCLAGEKKERKRNTGQQLFIFLFPTRTSALSSSPRAPSSCERVAALVYCSSKPRAPPSSPHTHLFTSSASSPFFNHPPGMLLLLCVAVVVLAEGSSGRRQIFSGWR